MTLVETLVALSILSLISIFLFSGLRTGSALWLKHEERSDVTSQTVMTQDLLRSLIERTYPGMPAVTDGTGRVLFSGMPQRMDFITFLPERISPGGLHKATLSLTDQAILQLAWSATGMDALSPETSTGGENRQSDLLLKLQTFEISYFGQRDGEQQTAWHETWTKQRKLPALVRIRLTSSTSAMIWPDLVVAPHIDVDAKCVYDPLTYGCRGR